KAEPKAEAEPKADGEPKKAQEKRASKETAEERARKRRTGKRQARQEGSATGTGQRRKGGRQSRAGAQSTGARKRRHKSIKNALTVATDLEDHYSFIGDVGEGAMGKVLLALDNTLNRKVAFKQITAEVAKQGTLAGKFTCEAQITAQLDHPNIVPVYTLETAPDGNAAYTMKLIRGHTIEDLIDAVKARYKNSRKKIDPKDELSEDSMLNHFLKVCDAMAYAHSRGVVHRDLKPENIMVGAFNEIYVMDWGISKPFTDDVEEPVLTIETEDEGELIIGTPQYMSPEQANGENEILSDRSDQYALGLILYEITCL
ncbi:MAG: protein kinase, partial [Proteobacteria bacterium]|nr:protein kinase [Pseudomonadota bacterium]